jgi:hypothetical protein
VLSRLGLPWEAGTFVEPDIGRFTGPLDGSEKRISVRSDPDLSTAKDRERNAHHTIFALRQGSGVDVFLVLLGALLGCWIWAILDLDRAWANLAVGACLGGIATGLLCLGQRRYRCTDTSCKTRIPAEATVCPGCGGRVGGRIRSKREIYAGEE